MNFRDLRADEIEIRVAYIGRDETSLLLYKDARCDMNILDESVGSMNWTRQHTRDNANCIVSIWDAEKKMWISKEDTGVESYSQKEKGLASDSFKRACFNWGIGRELYSAPQIKIKNGNLNIQNGKNYDDLKVTKIKVEDKKIVELEIMNCRTLKIIFRYKKQQKKIDTEIIREQVKKYNISLIKILENYNVKNLSNLTVEQFEDCEKLINKHYAEKKG